MNTEIEYAVVYLNESAIAVTQYPIKKSPIYVNFINRTITNVFIIWTTKPISKPEYETYIEFGIPYVPTTDMRTMYLSFINKSSNELGVSTTTRAPYSNSIVENQTLELSVKYNKTEIDCYYQEIPET